MVDKLSIHFKEDKSKYMVFHNQKKKKKNVGTLDINYGDIKTKQYYKVIYLGCELDENLSGEVMALKVINKVNGWLKFPYRKNRFKNIFKKPLVQCYNSTTF